MALSVIDVSDSGQLLSASSATFAHDVSGSDTAIFVSTGAADAVQGDRDVSTVTYNSDALTDVRQDDNAGAISGTTIWRRIAPDAGTNNVVVTWGGTCSGCGAGAITFAGANQTDPVDASTGDNAVNEDPISTGITTQTDNAYVIDAMIMSGAASNVNTVGGSQTEIANIEINTSRDIGASYRGPISPAGATTMEWDETDTSEASHTLVAVKPSGAAPQTVNLTALTLASSVPSSSVTPGGVTVTANALTLASSVPSATIVATVTLAMNTLTLASSVPSASLVLGAVTTTLNTLTLAGSVPSATVVPGGVTATLNALTLAGSVPSATVTPGEATVTLNALTLASSVPNLAVAGDVSITLNTLTLASTLLDLTITRGAKKALKGGWPFWRF